MPKYIANHFAQWMKRTEEALGQIKQKMNETNGEDLEERLSDLESNHEELEFKLEELDSKHDELSEKVEDLEGELADAESRIYYLSRVNTGSPNRRRTTRESRGVLCERSLARGLE